MPVTIAYQCIQTDRSEYNVAIYINYVTKAKLSYIRLRIESKSSDGSSTSKARLMSAASARKAGHTSMKNILTKE